MFEIGSLLEKIPHPLANGTGIARETCENPSLFEVVSRRFTRESSAWGDEVENVRSPDLGIIFRDTKLVVNASV